MIYWMNKMVGWVASPMGLETMLLAAALICLLLPKRRVRMAVCILTAAFLIFWMLGSSLTVRLLEWELERDFPVRHVDETPEADAIVLLGGGMVAAPACYPYADMASAADRVWHAVRLYKAGKAPFIMPSGSGDLESTVPLLKDFGVPESAIKVESKARNTEENAKFVAALLGQISATNGIATNTSRPHSRSTSQPSQAKPKILLVTSAWHMRRSMLMYRRYAPELEIIPAAIDYEMLARQRDGTVSGFVRDLLPDAEAFFRSSYLMKEYVGYWGYRLLRR